LKKDKKIPNGFFGLAERYGVFVLGAIFILTVAIKFAVPVRDGDFFWHVKYGEYMVENTTLIPDHSIYSWTPADNETLYCAWIAEIILYVMNKAGGLPLLFTFRYLCIFILILIVWSYARSMGQGKNAFTFLVLMVAVLSSQGAYYMKPEILSMLFMALTSGIYFSVKASLWVRWETRPFLLFPVIFLLWVNTHGVFFFGLMLLGLITFGEILNYYLRRKWALNAKGIRHLLMGAVLSLGATFVTPYGYKMYPHFLNYLPGRSTNLGITNVGAFSTIFEALSTHLVDYWLIMLISFGVLFSFLVWKKREWDWGVFLPTVFLSFVFAEYERSAFYWSVFWGMSVIYMQRRLNPYWQGMAEKTGVLFQLALKSAVALLFLYVSIAAMYDAKYRPFVNEWLGFGISYQNPVQASSFLKEYRPGKLLYNSYNPGGYLIYDLYPVYKVFMDGRYFPYRSWGAEYFEFGHGPMPINDFLKKHPFDVALVDYQTSKPAIRKFLLSEEWEPVFYGPSSIIFVKNDVHFSSNLQSLNRRRFDDLRNLNQAYNIFIVAQALGDMDTAGYILQMIKKRFSKNSPIFDSVVTECTWYQEGLKAFSERDYEKALENLAKAGFGPLPGKADLTLTRLLNWKAKQFFQEREYGKALSLIEWIIDGHPENMNGLFDAGILGYWIEHIEKTKKRLHDPGHYDFARAQLYGNTAKWRAYLKRFLELAPDHKNGLIAKSVLEGRGLRPEIQSVLMFDPGIAESPFLQPSS